MKKLGNRNKNERTRNIYFVKHEIIINIGRSGLLSQEQKKTFVQKLGTIVNYRNINQFRNKKKLLGKIGTIYIFYIFEYDEICFCFNSTENCAP